MNRKIAIATALIVAFGLLTFGGCGPGRPDLTPVAGKITYQGKPVTEGMIMFQPDRGRPAVGTIGPDGSYRLTTFEPGDGALLGRHRVTIQAARVNNAPRPKSFEEEVLGTDGAAAVLEWLVPEKYSRPDTTPLTAEVKPGRNAIDFDLPADPGRSSP